MPSSNFTKEEHTNVSTKGKLRLCSGDYLKRAILIQINSRLSSSHLNRDDMANIRCPNWMTGTLIHSFFEIFKHVDPSVIYNDTMLMQSTGYQAISSGSQFMQPAHIEGNHFVLLSNFGMKKYLRKNCIFLYDSLLKFDQDGNPIVSHDVLLQAAMLLCVLKGETRPEYITLKVCETQQQQNSSDCGFFVCCFCCLLWKKNNLASTTLTCNVRDGFLNFLYSADPTSFTVRKRVSRDERSFVPSIFPLKGKEIIFKVICHCRLPEIIEDTFECHCGNFFHIKCYLISNNVWKGYPQLANNFECYNCWLPGSYRFFSVSTTLPSFTSLREYMKKLSVACIKKYCRESKKQIRLKKTLQTIADATVVFNVMAKYDVIEMLSTDKESICNIIQGHIDKCYKGDTFFSAAEKVSFIIHAILDFENVVVPSFNTSSTKTFDLTK
jgi:hypothetical protein